MLVAVALTAGGVVTWSTGIFDAVSAVLPPAGYRVRFSDHFEGAALDTSKWNTFITSNGANGRLWNGNGSGGSSPATGRTPNDLEYDVPSQLVVGHGLTILATANPIVGAVGRTRTVFPWRSGAISTYGKFEFTGGYIDVVAKSTTGSGMWPGIFLLPGQAAHHGDNYEVDIFEGGYDAGGTPSRSIDAWALHTPDGSIQRRTNVGVDLGAAFHHYGLLWIPGKRLVWYFDRREIGRVQAPQSLVPDEPMELIIDLQVASAYAAVFHTTVRGSTPTRNAFQIRSVTAFGPTGAAR